MGQGVTSLSVNEFLGRWLEHVPPRGMQTVRGYGLYSGNQHSRRDQVYAALGRVPPEQVTPLSWQELCNDCGSCV
jgi:Putative transposase